MSTISYKFAVLGDKIEHSLEKGFNKIALFIGNHYILCIIVSLLIAGGLGFGYQYIESETKNEKIWIPQDSDAINDLDYYKENFGEEPRIQSFLIITDPEKEDILVKKYINELFDIYQDLLTVKITDNGTEYTYETLCNRPSPYQPCIKSGILDVWDWSIEQFNNQTANDNDVKTAIRGYFKKNISKIIGDYDATTVVGYAATLSFFSTPDSDFVDVNEKWEQAFLDKFVENDYEQDGLTIYGEAARSSSDEIGRSITEDLNLVFVSIGLISFIIIVSLGKFDKRGSRISLAFYGIITILMGIGAGFGLAGWSKIVDTPTVSVSPFLVLGLGADAIFIFSNSYRKENDEDDEIKEVLSRALGHSGTSVIISSLTNVVAFCIGATSKLPGISSFCIYTAFSILMVTIFQIFFFCPCLVIDEMRRRGNRYDIFCCFKFDKTKNSKKKKNHNSDSASDSSSSDNESSSESESESESDNTNTSKKSSNKKTDKDQDKKQKKIKKKNKNNKKKDAQQSTLIQRFLKDKFGPFIMDDRVRIIILVVTIAYFGVAIWLTTGLKIEFKYEDLIPKDSYLQDKLAKKSTYFGDVGSDVNLITKAMDYHNVETQDELIVLIKDLSKSELMNPDAGYSSWLDAFLSWLSVQADKSNLGLDENDRPISKEFFYQDLQLFLNTSPNQQYQSDLVYKDDSNDELNSALMSTTYVPLYTSQDNIDAMDASRKVVSDSDIQGEDAFVFNFTYLFTEQFKILGTELIQNVCLSLVAVCVIATILLAHPMTGFLVFLTVLTIDIAILGSMRFWDLNIDSVTVTLVVLASGLNVDLSSHLAHYSMISKGTRKERVITGLDRIGKSVLLAIFSTFIGILVLAFSGSEIFIAFFKMFFLTVVLAIIHSFFFLPVLMSFFLPQQPSQILKKMNESKKKENSDAEENSDVEMDSEKKYEDNQFKSITLSSDNNVSSTKSKYNESTHEPLSHPSSGSKQASSSASSSTSSSD
ncbi:patched domain-containing protein [Anaeramoeba flamelloides]|uniref:Patched domain-containing protein n=1 Tax=Anaeramoeba flamelloides TaxID=1746091 RepID=A0AAV8A2U4_9EUKA|nr:patched domain-containing protein [Anaeramoeba flamelloides]